MIKKSTSKAKSKTKKNQDDEPDLFSGFSLLLQPTKTSKNPQVSEQKRKELSVIHQELLKMWAKINSVAVKN
jgi:hypothetical protein